MWRLLKFLFTGDWHLHKWVKRTEVHTYEHSKSTRPIKTRYVMECEHCGKVESVEI